MINVDIPITEGYLAGVLHQPKIPKSDAVLLMCHGFRGSRDGGGRAVRLAEIITEGGFATLRFDFTPVQPLSRQVEEIAAVVKYCRDNLSKKVILLGRSMGGSASLAFAAQDQNIAGLCLWATPWNLVETFQLALGPYYKTLLDGQPLIIDDEFGHLELTADFLCDFNNFDLLTCIKKLPPAPLLIIHGSADEVVPAAQAETIYQTANEPKDIVIINGGNHQLAGHTEEAAEKLLNWLSSSFLPRSI